MITELVTRVTKVSDLQTLVACVLGWAQWIALAKSAHYWPAVDSKFGCDGFLVQL